MFPQYVREAQNNPNNFVSYVLTYFTYSRTISPHLVTWEEAVWPNTVSLLQDLTFGLQFMWTLCIEWRIWSPG